ncbi:enoyl-CoA hydratase/isomerase family protein [Rhodococcus artemisiae]|uniref:Enoyl-CoA hydratase/isomerase family protein n=1 Tax=Rhodococcus artemisiae TaxID=714159 RepID=A0ABU7LBS6_9NOCA|nr:enoyl-CoA hydratase/isomerase family protein [Rhodococcus artemisiae]MEE2059001.1 enoyl-CoA hydratase/isomerase family protein [Rhodococcus artemisiae]
MNRAIDFAQYQRLALQKKGNGVLLVTLGKSESTKAADGRMHAEMASIWTDAAADADVRVIVVTGAGKLFSAGGDLALLEELIGNHDKAADMLDEMSRLVYNMMNCDKPIISAINGAAVGAGLVVALMADISICAADARLGDGHVKLGLAAGDHSAILWPLLIGMAKARYYLLTGDLLTGEEAERIGLVTKSVPRAEVVDEAMRVAERLAAGSQTAIRWTKRALTNWLRMAGPIFDQSAAYEMLGFMGPDIVEGVAALREKRPPQFPSAQNREITQTTEPS